MKLLRVHHVAIICSNYEVSKHFYTKILGLQILREAFRAERNSYKLDLQIPGGTQLELFSFPEPPARPTQPEARGLRHLAFEVGDVAAVRNELLAEGIAVEDIRIDEFTGQKFTFFRDPDDLPLELYEATAG